MADVGDYHGEDVQTVSETPASPLPSPVRSPQRTEKLGRFSTEDCIYDKGHRIPPSVQQVQQLTFRLCHGRTGTAYPL